MWRAGRKRSSNYFPAIDFQFLRDESLWILKWENVRVKDLYLKQSSIFWILPCEETHRNTSAKICCASDSYQEVECEPRWTSLSHCILLQAHNFLFPFLRHFFQVWCNSSIFLFSYFFLVNNLLWSLSNSACLACHWLLMGIWWRKNREEKAPSTLSTYCWQYLSLPVLENSLQILSVA